MREFEKKRLYALINLAESKKDYKVCLTHPYEKIADLLKQCELIIDKYGEGICCKDKTLVCYTFKSDSNDVLNDLNHVFYKKMVVELLQNLLEDDLELISEDGEFTFKTKLAYNLDKLEFAPKHTFENCEEELLNELEKAEHSIFAAVAWFTNPKVMEVLIKKANEGVDIVLLLDQGHEPDGNDKGDMKNYNFISKYGTLPFLVCPCLNLNENFGKEYQNIMHHKYCIIDNKTVVHGTYNWTIKAEYNDEDMTTDSNEKSVSDFCDRFKKLRIKYNKKFGFDYSSKFWG